jgi:hypothetical protein
MGLIYDRRELTGVMTTRPGVISVLHASTFIIDKADSDHNIAYVI